MVRRSGRGPLHQAADHAVTPIIGTIFILAITVVGMGMILFLGAPVISKLQDEGALRGAAAQLEGMRHDIATLSIPDTAKAPGLAMPEGQVTLADADAFVVTAVVDPTSTYQACDMHIASWAASDGADTTNNKLVVSLSTTANSGATCRGLAASGATSSTCPAPPAVAPTAGPASLGTNGCIEVYQMSGATLTAQAATFPAGTASGGVTTTTVTLPSGTFDGADWLVQITNGQSGTSKIAYAQAWIVRTAHLSWQSRSLQANAYFEMGAVFLRSGGSDYLQAAPTVAEQSVTGASAASVPFLLRLPALTANPAGAIPGTASGDVLLRLSDSTVRAQSATATRLRIDTYGPHAQVWCQSLLLRNTFQSLATGWQYAADAAYPCTNGSAVTSTEKVVGVRSVQYGRCSTALTIATCAAANVQAFPFEFVHARLLATLQI